MNINTIPSDQSVFCLFLALPSQPPVHIPHTTKQAQCMAQFQIATFFDIIIGWDDVVGLACEDLGLETDQKDVFGS